jgi:hypothetical protein
MSFCPFAQCSSGRNSIAVRLAISLTHAFCWQPASLLAQQCSQQAGSLGWNAFGSAKQYLSPTGEEPVPRPFFLARRGFGRLSLICRSGFDVARQRRGGCCQNVNRKLDGGCPQYRYPFQNPKRDFDRQSDRVSIKRGLVARTSAEENIHNQENSVAVVGDVSLSHAWRNS